MMPHHDTGQGPIAGIQHQAMVAAVGFAGPDRLQAAVRNFELRVDERPLAPHVWGLSRRDGQVWINTALPDAYRRVALAHEVGHFVLWSNYRPSGRDEELFADWFAYEMLVPREQVAGMATVHDAWASCHEPAFVVAAQYLATHPDGPSMIASLEGFLVCRSCGHRQHHAGCECAVRRRRPLAA